MARGDLKLTLGSLTVTFRDFIGSDEPRLDSHNQQVEFSANGACIVSGPAYNDRCIWTVNAVFSEANAELIRVMWREQNRLRREQSSFQITIDDETSRFVEDSPRTRALVPSTSEDTTIATGFVAYWGRFYGIFTSEPKPSKIGLKRALQFTMIEGDLSL